MHTSYLAILLVSVALIGCSMEPMGPIEPYERPLFEMMIVSGDTQVTEAGHRLTEAMIVRVLIRNEPAMDKRVAWISLRPINRDQSAAFCGSRQPIRSGDEMTDGFGVASAVWKLDPSVANRPGHVANIFPLICRVQATMYQNFGGVRDSAFVIFTLTWTKD